MEHPEETVIVSAVRTPMGRYAGALKDIRPDDLAALTIAEAVRRAGVSSDEIEDVILGCANQSGEDNRNVARMALLLAGLPIEVAGQTVNRLCGSGMQAVNAAAHAIQAERGHRLRRGRRREHDARAVRDGQARRGLPARRDASCSTRRSAGASSTRASPRCTNLSAWARPPRTSPRSTASRAKTRTPSPWRATAAPSPPSTRAASATRSSPLTCRRARRAPRAWRPTSSRAAIPRWRSWRKLKPAFRKGGSVTAGNSSGINDGAAALVLAARSRAEAAGWRPRARVVASAVAGVDPAYMGLGPIPATRKALATRGADRRRS